MVRRLMLISSVAAVLVTAGSTVTAQAQVDSRQCTFGSGISLLVAESCSTPKLTCASQCKERITLVTQGTGAFNCNVSGRRAFGSASLQVNDCSLTRVAQISAGTYYGRCTVQNTVAVAWNATCFYTLEQLPALKRKRLA